MNRLVTKVNPVEALLDDDYFLRKLHFCHGERNDNMNIMNFDFQRRLTDFEDNKSQLLKEVQALNLQLKNLTEENLKLIPR
jgi:hypothetical protein